MKKQPTPFSLLLRSELDRRDLTIDMACEMLGLSRSTLQSWLAGGLPQWRGVNHLAKAWPGPEWAAAAEQTREARKDPPGVAGTVQEAAFLSKGRARLTIDVESLDINVGMSVRVVAVDGGEG
jgi:hypothetical protein